MNESLTHLHSEVGANGTNYELYIGESVMPVGGNDPLYGTDVPSFALIPFVVCVAWRGDLGAKHREGCCPVENLPAFVQSMTWEKIKAKAIAKLPR